MSYKPDEATLAAYLYGELSQEENDKVESYLQANPETKKEVEAMQSIRGIMGKLPDREVATPSFVFDSSPTVVVGGGSGNAFLRSTIAIAASIMLIMIMGYLTKMNMGVGDNGFQLSFGNQTQPANQVTEDDIKGWMSETLAQNNQSLLNKISEVENELGEQRKQIGSSNVRLANYKVDPNLIDQYVNQIKTENRDIILSLMEVSNRDQKQYMDELMADFANFLEAQRQTDLNLIEDHINQLANNTDPDLENDYGVSEE